MNMRPVHFAVYECSLLFEAGISVVAFFDIMLEAHADQPDVVDLFTDLKRDWNEPSEGFSYKMVKPFADRASVDKDFLLGRYFTEVASITGDAGRWRELAIAFLLRKKIQSKEPGAEDIAVARFLLQYFTGTQEVTDELLSWSSSPQWKDILIRSDDLIALPGAWWGTFDISGVEKVPLKTMGHIRERFELSGLLEEIPRFETAWNQYTMAYDSIKD